MIDAFRRIAQKIHRLRIPAVVIGLVSLSVILVTIFTSKSHDGDRFLVPGIVGLLWALSTFAFIVVFASTPEKATRSSTILGKLKRKLVRAWYWLLGITFIVASLAAMLVSVRMAALWLRDYG